MIELAEDIAAIRQFNRAYTRRIGLLNRGLAQQRIQPCRSAHSL